MASKFITQTAFIEYLKKAKKRKEVYECSFSSCPLAKATGKYVGPFKFSNVKYPEFEASDFSWEKHDVAVSQWDYKADILPEWAIKFIDVFDEIRVNPEQQSAELALFIMRNLKDESDMIIRKVYAKFGEKV